MTDKRESPGRPVPLRLWPGDAPLAAGSTSKDIPTLTPYLTSAPQPRGAVVICPGGGYGIYGDHEGHGYALWLAANAYQAFVLHYRLGTSGYRHPAMLLDAARAIRTVRSQAQQWEVPKNKIAIMGSSAGGHLAALLLTGHDAGNPDAADPVERASSRPDLGILCYPVITLDGPHCNRGSRRNLLGSDSSAQLNRELSAEQRVSPDTPPCFLWHCTDDQVVTVDNSFIFAQALREAGVAFELHIFEKGGHGAGLQIHPSWSSALLDWLSARWA